MNQKLVDFCNKVTENVKTNKLLKGALIAYLIAWIIDFITLMVMIVVDHKCEMKDCEDLKKLGEELA